MTVHPFGACSSASIANYVLQKVIVEESGTEAYRHNFYVDDCLRAGRNEYELAENAGELVTACARGGFSLTKFVSNSPSLLSRLKQSFTNIVIEPFPSISDALGIKWDIARDILEVKVAIRLSTVTKRTLLAGIASVYDPLGIAGPLLLPGRLILQDCCRNASGWDDLVPEEMTVSVKEWLDNLTKMDSVSIPRSLVPMVSAQAKYELHIFSDASLVGYCSVSYLRIVDANEVSCRFVFAKTRVAPIKEVSVPRLELAAAALSVQIYGLLRECLTLRIQRYVFRTDSTVVLKYINNDKARYKIFVANRIALIREHTTKDQWKFVPGSLNCADDGTRGVDSERWTKGPEFLLEDESKWPNNPEANNMHVLTPDMEVRVATVKKVVPTTNPFYEYFDRFSDWNKSRLFVSWMLRYAEFLGNRNTVRRGFIGAHELRRAELAILRVVQKQHFSKYS